MIDFPDLADRQGLERVARARARAPRAADPGLPRPAATRPVSSQSVRAESPSESPRRLRRAREARRRPRRQSRAGLVRSPGARCEAFTQDRNPGDRPAGDAAASALGKPEPRDGVESRERLKRRLRVQWRPLVDRRPGLRGRRSARLDRSAAGLVHLVARGRGPAKRKAGQTGDHDGQGRDDKIVA